MAKMNIMLLGCGTVGGGVYKTLMQKRRFIEDRLAPPTHPVCTSFEKVQGYKFDHRAQYVRFRMSGLNDEQARNQLHGALEEMGFQVMGWTQLKDKGNNIWVGFICSNWNEERWTDGLITRSLPISDYRSRPCLEKGPQTGTDPMAASVLSLSSHATMEKTH